MMSNLASNNVCRLSFNVEISFIWIANGIKMGIIFPGSVYLWCSSSGVKSSPKFSSNCGEFLICSCKIKAGTAKQGIHEVQ